MADILIAVFELSRDCCCLEVSNEGIYILFTKRLECTNMRIPSAERGLPTVGTESWNSKTAQKNHAFPGNMLEKLFRRRRRGTKGAMVALSHTLWKNKMVRAVDIDMLETKRSKPLHILWPNLLPVVAQFVQRILYIPGVPQNDHIYH